MNGFKSNTIVFITLKTYNIIRQNIKICNSIPNNRIKQVLRKKWLNEISQYMKLTEKNNTCVTVNFIRPI